MIGIIYLLKIAVMYFLPSIIALARRHSYVRSMFVLNIILGWTFFGWVALFVWSLATQTQGRIRAECLTI